MAQKKYNWSKKEWPNFSFDKEKLEGLEFKFSQNDGVFVGVLKHINEAHKSDLLIELLSSEALNTSAIEGEILNRESLQSSIKRNLGLAVDNRKVPAAEYGISEMMVDLYLNYDKKLSHAQLFEWHKMLTNGRRDISDIGKYRTHLDPMQVVSGRIDRPNIHFEAPPSARVSSEMQDFVTWFNEVHFGNKKTSLLPLAKAGIVHLYFVSIHPFEDGNGRIARALAEKSIGISTAQATLTALSFVIEAKKKDYYQFLEQNNKELEITDWLVYFGETILAAQEETLKRIDFLIEKTKFFDKYASVLNERQLKVIEKLFDAGHEGFKGGLSAHNYKTISKTSASTTTRDLQELLEQKILFKTGNLKGTRYWLSLETNSKIQFSI